MKDYNNNADVIHILIRWKYHIVIITLIGILLAVVFSSSLFITPKFKSTAIAYPANIASYSDESETEQMLQVLQSKDIQDSVIKRFDLARHWEIDSAYKYFYTALYYEYSKSVSISKTPFESVNITVLDKDPQIACDMVNAIIEFYNKKVRQLHNEKYLEVIKMYDDIIRVKERGIDSLQNELRILGEEYGLIDFDNQSLEITKGYLRTVTGASQGTINEDGVAELKKNFESKGGQLITLVELLRQEARTYSNLKADYEDAIRFYTDELSYANIVTDPFPADKKASPIRWLIVLFTAMATFVLTIIVIMFVEKYKNKIDLQVNLGNKPKK
jgi:capsular polysaccharide biosynthesis protein